MTSVREFSRLVGGDWREPAGDAALDVADPADLRRVVGRVPAMRAADVPELYEAAAAAADGWRRRPAIARGEVLAGAAALLRERTETIAADLTAEMGKTRAAADGEVAKSAEFLDYYAGLARTPYGSLLPDARPGVQTSVRVEPVGVVLLITPWNDPLLTPARKLAPALAAGNAVIIKPAGQTPIVTLHLARALHDAGLPAGVLGTATGDTAEIAGPLLHDARLAAVSFTGSTRVGRHLRRELADTGVRLQTEMGGKNAAVVLADADLDAAAGAIGAAAFGQTGQRCTATSRVIVVREVSDALIDALGAQAGAARLGPGTDPATEIGPLVSEAQLAGVRAHLDRAARDGVRVAATGEVPAELSHGCFLAPTVLVLDGAGPTGTGMDMAGSGTDAAGTGATGTDAAIWRDEVFGPVVAVLVVDDLDAAVAAANDSAYGLAAAVYTRDLSAAHTFADRVDAGQIAVNLPTTGWDVHHPFGGFRDSGSAFKEQGIEGLRFYTRLKTVAIGYGA